MKFPTLYKKSNTGAIQAWAIEVEGTDITTTFGQLGGKQQTLTEAVAEGKNLGRANETTSEQQAAAETKSKWEKQVKKGYVQSAVQAAEGAVDAAYIEGGVLPMLAPNKIFGSDRNLEKKISFPAFVQPKLDGSRCIAVIKADGDVTLWSRTRKAICSAPHIVEALQELVTRVGLGDAEELVLDGELYNHTIRTQTDDAEGFQKLMSLTRKEAPDPDGAYKALELHVYDVVMNAPFEQRLARLKAVASKFTGPIRQVNTFEVHTKEEVFAFYEGFLNAKYEGAMVRNAHGKYEGGKRSSHLQKVKHFDDGEFRIVGAKPGRGKFAQAAVFVCDSPRAAALGTKDPTFDCTAPGDMDAKEAYLAGPERWQGQWLTIQHQGWTKDGFPRCPIAKEVRPLDEAMASKEVPEEA